MAMTLITILVAGTLGALITLIFIKGKKVETNSLMNKKGSRTVAARWCHFRDNTALRVAIQKRISDRKLRLMDIERATGVKADRVSRYLNRRKPNLNQFHLYQLCDFLEIDVRLDVKFR